MSRRNAEHTTHRKIVCLLTVKVFSTKLSMTDQLRTVSVISGSEDGSKGIENLGFVTSTAEDDSEPEPEISPNDYGRFRNNIRNIGKAKSTELITYTWNNICVSTGSQQLPYNENEDLDKSVDSQRGSGKFRCFNRGSTKSKQLLKNVYGMVRPGELVAIMGASGAGKTTLLNVLTFRNTANLKVTGSRAANGVTVGPDSLTAVSAYVQQDYLFIGSLTVREHLIFQSLVRMHEHIPYDQRMHRVEEVIQELGLSKCAETRIGIPGRLKGISGGEMKRLAFASEVLTNPPLMFCDEPTSGLDSYMAKSVVSVLKNLASRGKTIVCTIHQPSSQVFEMFDTILLLAEGRVAFLGETKQAVKFLTEQGFECPRNYNPADFFIQTLAIHPDNEEDCREVVTRICDSFDQSQPGFDLKKKLDTEKVDKESAEYLRIEAATKQRSPYKATWFAQFKAVIWRSWISYLQDPFVLRIRVFQTVVMALLIGVIYFGQEFNQDGVQNINGVLFLFLTNMTFMNVFAVVNVFCLELPIFLREHWNGMYRTDVYFLAKTLAELPFFILFPILFTAITYYMIGLNPSFGAFVQTTAILTLVGNTACSFGYLLSCLASSVTIALAMGPALVIPFMLFGGFFLNSGSIPIYLVWIKYISWFFYGNEALVIAQWDGVGHIECNRFNATCPENGDVVIKSLDFNKDNLALDFVALAALFTTYRILAFLALLMRTFRKSA